ncbi:MAG: hypothetical protein ABEJ79_11810 [Halolamina sp.]
MYSRGHAALSLAVGLASLAVVPPGTSPPAVVGLALVLGVGIDVDHFLLARLNDGSWRHAVACLRDPRRVVLDQAAIFERGDLYRDQRLLSHHLVGGVVVAGLWLLAPALAGVALATLYVHVVADLYSDARSREAYVEGLAEE